MKQKIIDKIKGILVSGLKYGIVLNYPRHSTRFAKNYFKRNKIKVAEIGTLRGINAKSILKELDVSEFYVIDPYNEYEDYLNSEINMTQKNLKNIENKAKMKLSRFPQVKFIKKYSSQALNDIPNNLDFIYIDGNHEYKYVKEDIKNYYLKLKSGGILSGHDISTPNCKGVRKAIIEFCFTHNITPYFSRTDWWFIK